MLTFCRHSMHRLSIVKGSPSLASTYCTSCCPSGSAKDAILSVA